MTRPCLLVGDTHGHLDRLEALLEQEGIIRECPDSGYTRVNHDVEVVQLGDLGHFGADTRTADRLTWEYALPWLDVVLWGNHDRATVESGHIFSGYSRPDEATKKAMQKAIEDGKLKLAHSAHGFLFTHAGLHSAFKHNKLPEEVKATPEAFADWLNRFDASFDNWEYPDADSAEYAYDFHSIRDAISSSRGGRSTYGGILWRDADEKLYKDFRQVFGHSSKPKVRKYQGRDGYSYCIDIGSQHNGKLAGLWLPEERVVEVKVDEPNSESAFFRGNPFGDDELYWDGLNWRQGLVT